MPNAIQTSSSSLVALLLAKREALVVEILRHEESEEGRWLALVEPRGEPSACEEQNFVGEVRSLAAKIKGERASLAAAIALIDASLAAEDRLQAVLAV